MSRENSDGTLTKIININNISYCNTADMMRGNEFLNIIIAEIQKNPMGIFLDVCKRVGNFIAYNISFQDSPYLSMWPDFDYKVELVYHDPTDREVMNVTYWTRHIHVNRKMSVK